MFFFRNILLLNDSSGWTEEHPGFLASLRYRDANNKGIPGYAATNAICDQGTLSDSMFRIQSRLFILEVHGNMRRELLKRFGDP
jgi:hypothetical protein